MLPQINHLLIAFGDQSRNCLSLHRSGRKIQPRLPENAASDGKAASVRGAADDPEPSSSRNPTGNPRAIAATIPDAGVPTRSQH